MSILDGRVTLDRDTKGGNNKKNNNDRRSNNQNNGGRTDRNNRGTGRRNYEALDDPIDIAGYSGMLGDEESDDRGRDNDRQEDRRATDILRFCENFTDCVTDMRQLRDVVADDFPDAIRHIRSYYSQKNSKQYIDAVNKLINIVSMSQFANTLSRVLESGVWMDDDTYDKCWRNIAFVLSTALETSHEKMHNDVIRKYANDILPRLWKPEINEIVTETGVTRELVLDLIIAIPMVGSEWNSSNIDAFYGRFLEKMLQHAEDNMDVLNWEVQNKLYTRFFDKGKTGLKIIGKYLTSEPVKSFESDVMEAVYNDFIKMIYSRLDEYDIKDIAYVFRFVSNFKKENNMATIFAAPDASKYENVRKGMLSAMEDPEVMKYLA